MATIMGSRSTAHGPQPSIVSNIAQSHPYTCNSCLVAFRNSDLQRTHMRTDWHRYNLKRKIAELVPLSYEVFSEKVLNAQASSSAVAAKASFEKSCEACQKKYYSENAYQNHLGSQKHRLREAVLAKNGRATGDDETASVISSTISLGEPISIDPVEVKAPETIDVEAEAEFSKVVDGIKETSLTEKEPVSRRPTRPHHSSNEQRSEHPLSASPPQQSEAESGPTTKTQSTPLEIGLVKCLFCNYDSPNFRLNVNHMGKFHGLFIPEQDYLVDLEGLISWLHGKIVNNHECLYCHKIRGSAEGIQTHMRDKGHCMIAFEAEEDMIEVGQFYDFSSTYSNPSSPSSSSSSDDLISDFISTHAPNDSGGVRLPSRKILKTVISDSNGDEEICTDADENAEGWETDSTASSLDAEDMTALPIDDDRHDAFSQLSKHKHHSHSAARPHRAIDGFHSHAHAHLNAAYTSENELHLPSGRTAGHRSLQRYYRQNLHNHPSPAERMEQQQQQRLIPAGTVDGEGDERMPDATERGRQQQQVVTRANGGLGMLGVTDAKRREVLVVEKRETKRAQRAMKSYQWGVDRRGNSQKHFRDPLLQ